VSGQRLASALRLARRDMRGAALSFRFLAVCLTLGVAAIAAVGVFAGAVEEGLARDGRALLGGDVAFRLVAREATVDERAALDKLGAVSHVATLRAMAEVPSAGGRARRLLIDLKAVDGRYPLVGSVALQPATALDSALAPKSDPQAGDVHGAVATSEFAARLGVDVGGRFTIGGATFELRAILEAEPDSGAEGLAFGPKVIVSESGLRATGLIRPGSQVRHSYRVALPPGSTTTDQQAADAIARAFPQSGFRARTLADATPQARIQVERVRVFLTLVGFAALLVGGIGVALAVQSHLALKRSTIAVLKCLGASAALIARIYGIEVAVMAAAGIAVGLAAGFGLAIAAGSLAGDILPLAFTARAVAPALLSAAAAGVLATIAFTATPLARARAVSPALLLRVETEEGQARTPSKAWLQAVVALLVLVGAAAATAPDRRVVLFAALGTLAAAGLLIGSGRLLRTVGRSVHERLAARGAGGARLRLALANIGRVNAATVPVMVALGLAMTLFVALVEVEGNLRREIEERIPDRAPAYFFIDIQPADGPAFDAAVRSVSGAETIERRPMLRGRIVRVNGVPIEQVTIAPGARWVADGDRGLTVAPTPPAGTRLVAGSWWPADYSGPPLVSFDARAAQGFGVGIGDMLTFNVLGREVTARIDNLRAIDWTSFGVNFAVVLSPGALDGAPMTDIAAVYATPDAGDKIAEAVADRLPDVTAVRVRDVLETAIDLLTRIAGATHTVAAAAVGSGLLVLIGALAAARRSRLYEAAILRAVGASRATIVIVAAIEHGLIGLFAALLAAALGTLAGWAAVTYAIGMAWTFLPWPALATVAATVAATGLFGAAAAWRLLAVPPARLLAAEAA
jgi:putative ABC transport system permease protein